MKNKGRQKNNLSGFCMKSVFYVTDKNVVAVILQAHANTEFPSL